MKSAKPVVILIGFFLSLNCFGQIARGGITGGGQQPYPALGVASVVFANVGTGQEACTNGTSPAATESMRLAVQAAIKICTDLNYTHAAPSRRPSGWVVAPNPVQTGIPSLRCEAHASYDCWND